MYMNGAGMYMMAWMALVTLAVFAAIVAIVVWLARGDLFTRTPTITGTAQAEAVLRRRYAGDIDDEEYQRRLSVLRGQAPNAR